MVVRIDIRTKDKWREWLEKNHLKENKVEVVVHKKHTGKPSLTHKEFLDEAICFGWIDTTIKRIDDNTFIRTFCRRNDKSRWSENTLRYAKDLFREGKMSSEGIKRYKEGLQRPVHDEGIPKNPDMPIDVKNFADAKSLKAIEALPHSLKRMMYRMILRAKLPETKKKRVKMLIEMAQERQRKNSHTYL